MKQRSLYVDINFFQTNGIKLFAIENNTVTETFDKNEQTSLQ